jgi:hypothetical protein
MNKTGPMELYIYNLTIEELLSLLPSIFSIIINERILQIKLIEKNENN